MVTTRTLGRALAAGLWLSVTVACSSSVNTPTDGSSLQSYPDGAAIAGVLQRAHLGCDAFHSEVSLSRNDKDLGVVSVGTCDLSDGQAIEVEVFDSASHRRYGIALTLALWCLDSRDPAIPRPNSSIRPAPGPEYVHGANWQVTGDNTAVRMPSADIARATGGEVHTPDCLAAGAWFESAKAQAKAHRSDTTATTDSPVPHGDEELVDQLLGERTGPPRPTSTSTTSLSSGTTTP